MIIKVLSLALISIVLETGQSGALQLAATVVLSLRIE